MPSRVLTLGMLSVLLFLTSSPCTAVALAVKAQDHTGVTPIQKVIEMLGDMMAKGKQEKHEEEVMMAEFKANCEATQKAMTTSIEKAAAAIEQLNADILAAEADVDRLSEEIAALEQEVATAEADLTAATAVREKEKADFQAANADYEESIDALARAIAVLKSRGADVPQGAGLIQESSSTKHGALTLQQLVSGKVPGIPAKVRAVVESFLAVDPEGTSLLEIGAPEANAYESQSGGVVDMLEKLKLKFEDEKLALEKAEMNAQASYDMLAQSLHDQIEAGNDGIAKKKQNKNQRTADAAAAKGELEETQVQKADDEKTLQDSLAECRAKAEEYEKNQVTRKDEVEAITKAIEIMSSPEVSGSAEKHLPQLVQTSSGPSSFVQLRSTVKRKGSVRQQLTAFLRDRADKLNSRFLSLVAARAEADPFKKVKKMIKDMIVKLMEEANAEAEKKGWCDTELATNKQTREIKTSEVDELKADIDEATATNAKLKEDVKTLGEEIAELDRLLAEALQLREEEKAKNQIIIADAKAGETAVGKAIKVLKDFYDKAAQTSLLQSGTGSGSTEKETAEIANMAKAPYGGQQAESGGVIGMLEVCQSDFARLLAETTEAESAAQDEYDKMKVASDQDKAVKTMEMNHKSKKSTALEGRINDLSSDLEGTQKELDAALAYYEKLKPDCIDTGVSYEDRVAARKEEIVSLQEALKILSGEDLA